MLLSSNYLWLTCCWCHRVTKALSIGEIPSSSIIIAIPFIQQWISTNYVPAGSINNKLFNPFNEMLYSSFYISTIKDWIDITKYESIFFSSKK